MISVIMGIYNCQDTLAESIDSLFNQTYKNFELIMCDDCSTDGTYQIAKQYADEHRNIVLLKNESNRGLNLTLNHCLKYARGEYIARQDGDDLSMPDRFKQEVDFLESNPDFALVSCSLIHFDENGEYKTSKNIPHPKKNDFLRGSVPFFHACCMIRKSILNEVGEYSEGKYLLRVEDYHLWFKIYAKGYIGYNIQEPLYKWRDDFNAYKRRKFRYVINQVYVTFIGLRMLKFNIFISLFRTIRPIIVWLLPQPIYKILHRMNF